MLFISFSLIIAVVAFFISYYFADISVKFLSEFMLKNMSFLDKRTPQVAFIPIRAGYMLGIIVFVLVMIGIPDSCKFWFKSTILILMVFILSWLAFSIIDLFFGEWLADYLKNNKQDTIVGMIPFGRRFLKTIVVIFAILTFLQNIGINVTALLAGLGLGGIAVALGAQKMIGDLIGGIMLVLDQPIRVGDDCRFGAFQGTVEEIGIRTTKIRTTERTLVAVPNADFSQMQLENLSSRDRIRLNCIFGIRKDVTVDLIRFLLVEFQQFLHVYPKIEQQSVRVRFIGISIHSLDIEINCYILNSNNIEFLETKEAILLNFLDKIQKAGTGLAPSSSVHEPVQSVQTASCGHVGK